MACGCSKRRQVTPGGELLGYYVILPDGSEIPPVSKGSAPFISTLEARAEVRAAGGGTIRTLKRRTKR